MFCAKVIVHATQMAFVNGLDEPGVDVDTFLLVRVNMSEPFKFRWALFASILVVPIL